MASDSESIRATAIEAAEKLIPAPKASQYVGEWPEDERDLYRDTDWRSFTERDEALDRLRIHEAAVAVVDAVLPAVVAQVQADDAEIVKLRLVPVEVFGAEDGYGLCDAVMSWSDCNRAVGRIYRVDDPELTRSPGETVEVFVNKKDLAFFEQKWGDSDAAEYREKGTTDE